MMSIIYVFWMYVILFGVIALTRLGITCRRWNWRQCVRTRLSQGTTDALFIIDALGQCAEPAE